MARGYYPLVSIITPTWRRPELIDETIEHVREQTYRPLEHVIISDGPDSALRDRCFDNALEALAPHYAGRYVSLRMVELGLNWSSILPDSFCAAPLTVGMLVARGECQMWLADDERMTADHVSQLIAALGENDADFAYSRTEMYYASDPGRRWIIGTDPPRCGEITNVLYRTDLLRQGLYQFGAGMTSDWATISHWQSRGARHAFVDAVTLTHRADH
jgi:GT2 family glycosyltransferase